MRGLMVAAFLMLGFGASAWATEYFSEIADLPVADGLTEQKDKSTVFDAPVGRIITAYASGKVDADAVRGFYDSALPPLGWEKTGEGTFHRKAETLKIDVLGGHGGSPVNVSFTLSAESQQQ
ncbi:MAG TPA: hypothetical protein VFG64_09800 [Dongiaceae bacterium]|nr:hypothetical protein [Dongiaceae bacterium]